MWLFKKLTRRICSSERTDEELQFHVEKQTELNLANGMSPEDARRQALIEFAGVQQTREKVREVHWTHWMEVLGQDMRYGWRMLRKTPGFTAIALVTLSLGIGMNSAVFCLINQMLFRPLPARHPEQLVILRWHTQTPPTTIAYSTYGDCEEEFGRDKTSGCSFSQAFFKAAGAQSNIFSSIGATANPFGRISLSKAGEPAAALNSVQLVSGDYFETLGVGASLGRTLGHADDAPSAAPVLMLSYGYWQSAFGGNPSVIGTTVRLNGKPFTVVGVSEKGFEGLTPGNKVELWSALPARRLLLEDPAFSMKDEDVSNWWLVITARLKPGAPARATQAALSGLFGDQTVHGERPIFQATDNPGVELVPARQALRGIIADTLPPFYILLMAAGLVLLIACATIAGLLVVRAAAREKEIAIRLTLGARRARLIINTLTESLLLAILGGVMAVPLAYWGGRLLAILADDGQGGPLIVPHIDFRVLGFTAAVAMVTGVFFGLIPALRSLRTDLTPALNSSSSASSVSESRRSWFNLGNALVVAQVALAVVALVSAGMLVHALRNLRSVDPGFAVDNVLLFTVDGGPAGYKQERADGLYRDLRERFATLPGVTSAGYAFTSLLSGSAQIGRVHLPGMPATEGKNVDLFPVGPGFLLTMRIPMLAGRGFGDADFDIARQNAAAFRAMRSGASTTGSQAPRQVPLPAIVNDTFARQFFPQGNALGQFVEAPLPSLPNLPRPPGWQIVGLVRDAKYYDLRREIKPTMYLPATGGTATFELRTANDPRQLVPAVREITNRVDSSLALFDIDTQASQVDLRLFVEKRVAQLSSFFGLLALVLACAGIYGLLSYEVTRRRREIGIRMAVGAQQSDVVGMVLRHGLLLAAIGAVIGGFASIAVKGLLRSILYKVRAGDPVTLGAVVGLLLMVALAACYVPARRATRVDPLEALRYQ